MLYLLARIIARAGEQFFLVLKGNFVFAFDFWQKENNMQLKYISNLQILMVCILMNLKFR